MPASMKEIDVQMQKKQAQVAAEQTQAQLERDKATQFRNDGNMQQAQAHTDASIKHDQKAARLQEDVSALMAAQQTTQMEITQLEQQRDTLQQQRDQEIATIDDQIVKLRGSL